MHVRYVQHIHKKSEYDRINAQQKQKMKHKIQNRIYSIKVVHSVGSCAVK